MDSHAQPQTLTSSLMQLSPEQKIYIVDTNVFLHEPMAHTILSAGGNVVVIPIWVIIEADKFKQESSQRGAHAREFVRQLDRLSKHGDVHRGIELENGGTVIVDHNGKDKDVLPFLVSNTEYNNDLKILTVAMHYRDQYLNNSVALVSKDGALRVMARSVDVVSEDFSYDAVRLNHIDDLYSGIMEDELSDPEQVSVIVQSLQQNRCVSAGAVFGKTSRPYPNQYCKLRYQTNDGVEKTLCVLYKHAKDQLIFLAKHKRLADTSLQALNEEQQVALHFLLDEEIKIVSLSGIAGTGKTLLSLIAAIEMYQSHYQKIIIFRPNHELGKPIGFLPGDLKEKFNPWCQAIHDNLEFMEMENKHVQDELRYVIEPLCFIRGRTLHHSFIIVDDAQNLTRNEVKTLISRVGKRSKIVFNGDPDQVDTPYLDAYTNGFSCFIEKLKGCPLFAHIKLIHSERSEVAAIAAEYL